MVDQIGVQQAIEASVPALAVSVLPVLTGWTAWAEARREGPAGRRPVRGLVLTSKVVADLGGVRPAVTYAYEIGDEIFEGFTVNYGAESFTTPKKAQAVVDQYPPGAVVMVWCDPDNPADSVLTRKRRLWPLWGLTAAFALWAGALWLDVWRSL